MRDSRKTVGVVCRGRSELYESLPQYTFGQVSRAARKENYPVSYRDALRTPRRVRKSDKTAPKKFIALPTHVYDNLTECDPLPSIRRPSPFVNLLCGAFDARDSVKNWAETKKAEEGLDLNNYHTRQFQGKDVAPVLAALSLVGAIGLGAATSANNVAEVCAEERQYGNMCMPNDILPSLIPTADDVSRFVVKIVVSLRQN